MSKSPFYHFCLGSVCLDIFLKSFLMYRYAMPKSVQTKVNFKNLQSLDVTFDIGFLSFAFDVV